MLEDNFDVEIVQVQSHDETLAALSDSEFHLVLINRKLDRDYSDGIEILRAIKADDTIAHVPVMLITNFDEHHQMAIDAGGHRGFGKAEIDAPTTLERLSEILDPKGDKSNIAS